MSHESSIEVVMIMNRSQWVDLSCILVIEEVSGPSVSFIVCLSAVVFLLHMKMHVRLASIGCASPVRCRLLNSVSDVITLKTVKFHIWHSCPTVFIALALSLIQPFRGLRMGLYQPWTLILIVEETAKNTNGDLVGVSLWFLSGSAVQVAIFH
jgi:hypothetical protein